MTKPRARDLGLPFPGETGLWNAITDVPGVKVGYTTLTDDAKNMRTGVTAIIPRDDDGEPRPVWAGHYSLNGNGEMTGTHWIDDAGYFIGPVCITNTHGIGMVHHGATRWMMQRWPEWYASEHSWAMPVVAETYDGVLNDINAQYVTDQDAIDALNGAKSGPIAEGNVGGGNGMICYEFKGGTGSASRKVSFEGSQDFVVGALVQANHGIRPWLTICGVPVGEHLTNDRLRERETGSIIVILGTDAPLSRTSLRQLAKRAAIGIGRSGTPGGNSSGDIFLAFSTANVQAQPETAPLLNDRRELNIDHLDPLYLAAVQAVDEAIINAMVAAETCPTFKPPGLTCAAIDTDALKDVMQQFGRLNPTS